MPKIINGEIKLELAELFAVFLRTKIFYSWKNQLEYIEKFGTETQKREDIPIIQALKNFENEHTLDLCDFLPAECQKFELSKEQKALFKNS
jgi:hypothetical protein